VRAPLPVIIQTAYVGDCVLSLGLVRAAARAAERPVLVVTRPATAPLFEGDTAVEAVIPFDKRGRDAGPRGLLSTSRRLRAALAGRAAIALLAQGSVRSALLARLAGIDARVAFGDAPARLLATARAPRGPHRPDDELALLAAARLPCAPAPNDARFTPTPAEADRARCALSSASPAPLVALCPGSARATKAPPLPLLGALAYHLDRRGFALVVCGGPGDRAAAGALRSHVRAPLLDTTGNSLRDAAAILARCAAVVGGDSGLLHLAAAVGTPTVAIHGPTPSSPFSAGSIMVPGTRAAFARAVPCAPCSPSGPDRCPRGHHDCMRLGMRDLDALMNTIVRAADTKVLHG